MSVEEIRAAISAGNVSDQAFNLLGEIARIDASQDAEDQVQELVLRCLEHAEAFGPARPILSELARSRGLYPYLEQRDLGLRSQIAYEFHKPVGMEGVVFHAPQARVYRELMAGRSVILSAPTSFGKSLIIDALIMSGEFSDVLIVVPTIALIDETRRRIHELDTPHKIVTHLSQESAEQNVLILTQERVVEALDRIDIDLFVIDEFYKLSPGRGDDDRASILNHVFYTLANRGVQFYMLGPSVQAVPEQLSERFECTFLYEPYHTVVSELHPVDHRDDNRFEVLADLCQDLEGPTIVYCQSPPRAAELAKILAASRDVRASGHLQQAISWIGRNYHPDWHLTQALRSRVGVHHGRIPRALAQYVLRAFENDEIDLLICTSTLIEGVNTKARNVVVFDDKISTSKFDFFTFNNIRGRSGRMFQHFVGHVYLFYDPPDEELPFIDVPAITQSDDTPESLLLQLEEDDLTEKSRERVSGYREQEFLPLSVLRLNSGVEPEVQIAIAEDLHNLPERQVLEAVGWRRQPSYDELGALCNLIWKHVNGTRLGSGSIRSARHLTYRINELRRRPSIRSLIDGQLEYMEENYDGATADDAVQSILDFLRLWAGFHFPRLVQAVDRIQQHVLPVRGLRAGDLTPFANQVEGLFLGSAVMALEEYGLPIQISRKLDIPQAAADDVDAAVMWLRSLEPEQHFLSEFEEEILEGTMRSLA